MQMCPSAEIIKGRPPVEAEVVIEFSKLTEGYYVLIEYNVFNKEKIRQKIYGALRKYNNDNDTDYRISTRSYVDGADDKSFFVITRK